MNLTFKGFLRSYCRQLTGLETDSLSKLFNAVNSKSPAATEAVMVFAAEQGKAKYLATLASGTEFETNYSEAADKIENFGLQSFLQDDETPERYQKVYKAFLSKKDASVRDRRVILLMRDKTLEALENSKMTAYQVCKNLKLNKGNFYAYLNKGDATKISRETARKVMDYVCS